MSQPKRSGRCYGTLTVAPRQLRKLAGLELKRRRLLWELARIEYQRRQLATENELVGMEVPWLKSRSAEVKTRFEMEHYSILRGPKRVPGKLPTRGPLARMDLPPLELPNLNYETTPPFSLRRDSTNSFLLGLPLSL